jgi:nucleotide-binding universal stress UspA family protein
MFKHILIPTDGSKLAEKAVKHAIDFAKQTGARLSALHVTPQYRALTDEGFLVPSSPMVRKHFDDSVAARAKKILAGVEREAKAAGVACEIVTAANVAPYDEIIKQAKKRKCDLIMMASHGRRGITGVLLGSETVKVLTHSTIPVLVYR